MSRLSTLDTLSARIFVILLLGIGVAALVGGELADQRRVAEVRHIQAARAMEESAAVLTELIPIAPARRLHEAKESGRYIRPAPSGAAGTPEAELTEFLQARLPGTITATVTRFPVQACDAPEERDRKEGRGERRLRPHEGLRSWQAAVEAVGCWGIDARFADGSNTRILIGSPPLLTPTRSFDLAFIAILSMAATLLALLVARLAVAPVRTLARAAASVAPEEEGAPLAERGQTDVRAAVRAFNDMKRRLARHATEQNNMIAAITHDLQTPMTRMRLKLEAMEDDATRARLLSDWRAMRAIVDEGLELARSTHSRERPVLLDVDSLIESIVEDEVEAGHHVTFDVAARIDLRCRPQMIRRCIQNLVDNAVRYGGDAHISTRAGADSFHIDIRDTGAGIPADQLESVFEPMVRLEASRSRETGGTGLGLTIAQILARRNGAHVSLRNGAECGLVATITFDRPSYA